jgi:DNA-binding transcriptional LysR family regulator
MLRFSDRGGACCAEIAIEMLHNAHWMCEKHTTMNWDDFRIFLAVARAGTLLGAARSLGVNHTTVARRLSALERALEADLFVRQTTGTVLTPEGERLLVQAERVENAVVAADDAAGGGRAGLTGTVRIGAPDGFGTGFLAAQLPALAARHPGLVLELVPVPRSFSLSRREADIAVTMERPREGRLVARKLVDYGLGLYAAPAYLERHGVPGTRDSLRAHQLVGYVDDLLYSPSLDFREVFKDWRPTMTVSTAMGQMIAVAAGAGVGVLHNFMAQARDDLVRVLPEVCISRAYWLVVHEDLRATRRVSAVADFIVAVTRDARF